MTMFRRFQRWAREVNWLAVAAVVLFVAAVVLALIPALVAVAVVAALSGVGLAILTR